MSLFLFVAVPFWLLTVIAFYPKPSRGWRGIVIPFLGGLVIGMALISITLGLLTRNPFGIEIAVSYPWAWYRGPGWAFTMLTIGLGCWFHFKPTAYSRIRELVCWFSGVAFIYTFWYGISPEPGFDLYRSLISPVMWIGAIGTVTWLLERGLREDGLVKIVFYIAAVATPSLITFIPVQSAGGGVLIPFCLSFLLAVGSTVMIHLDSRGLLS